MLAKDYYRSKLVRGMDSFCLNSVKRTWDRINYEVKPYLDSGLIFLKTYILSH